MYSARMAEAHRSPQDGCAGEVHLAGFQDDRLVERLSARLVVFADEDFAVGLRLSEFPCSHPFQAVELNSGDVAEPDRQQAQNDRSADVETGEAHSPSLARLSVCRLNEKTLCIHRTIRS